MFQTLTPLLLQWATTALTLWVASHVFKGIRFADYSALWVSALLLGLVNSSVKPLIIVLTLPLTFLSFGSFLLFINAAMILLVAKLVRGFKVSGFWTALFASLFIAIFSFLLDVFVLTGRAPQRVDLPHTGIWL